MTRPSAFPLALRGLADLAELRGFTADAFDLRRAAVTIESLPAASAAELEHRARHDQVGNEPGIPASVQWRLREVAGTGARALLEAARTTLPVLTRSLLETNALTADEMLRLVRHLGVVTLPDLFSALDDGRVRQLFGDALDARLRGAAAALDSEARSIPLGRATDVLELLLSDLAAQCPALDALVPAGDARRFEVMVSSLVVVGRAADPPAAIEAVCAMRGVTDILHRSARRAIVSYQQLEIDVRVVPADEYGTVLFNTTGSRAHLDGVRRRRGRPKLARHESEVYAQAGLQFVEPELREGTGEIEAAAANRLPRLVSHADVRGDLHMHSTYSDGRDPISAMVEACCALGYAYMAITDHSENAAASRTLSIDQLWRQRDEIARVREQYPGITILHGVEVDILPNGRLDFSDGVLEGLDLVLASLHDSARQDGPTLTRRYLKAIRHPLVSVITHPANQLVGRRAGYPLDYEAVYEAAAETGTALEIDGAPSHLDLDGEHARAAVAAGVTVTIDSDCHRAPALDRQMRLGIGMARRGWVEPRHVLNTRPLTDVLAFFAAKRARR